MSSSVIEPIQRQKFGRLGKEVKRDTWTKDLDAKILVTSHNSRPGLGKTTMAIQMARDLDRNGWDADRKAVMDAGEYHKAYGEIQPGSVLLFDEIEGEADNRRAMSNKNVDLSQAWMQNRYRNMITICTLPSVNMLDQRLLELSDYWINVIDRGIAHPYKVLVNDFTGKVIRNRMGNDAVMRFNDLPDDDEDYQLLKSMKDERRTTSFDHYTPEEHRKAVEKAKKEVRLETRNRFLCSLVDETDMTQREIAELSAVDVTHNRVNQIYKQDAD